MSGKQFSSLTTSMFVPTKWNSAENKAKFGNDLMRFIFADFQRDKFTQKLYERLSNCFGHNAEYDRNGFYETWFDSTETRIEFLRNLCMAPCWGDPEYTFSDVERAIQREVVSAGVEAKYERQLESETQQREMQSLAELQAKYAPSEAVSSTLTLPVTPIQAVMAVPIQPLLF